MENQVTENQVQESQVVEEKKVLSQKEAVRTYLLEAIEAKGVVRAEGEPLKSLVTKDIRKVVKQRLFNSFRDGSIKLSKPKNDTELNKYCSGLISNWLSKDKTFNS